MAVTFVNASNLATAGASTGADVTPVLAAHQADDILIALVLVRDIDDTITWPSGWAQVSTTDRSTVSRAFVGWKRATSGAETNPLIDKSTATGDTYCVVYNFRGCITTGSPFDVAWSTNTGTVQNGTTTGITTSASEHHVILLMTEEDNVVTALTATATDPSSLTSRNLQSSATGADGTLSCHSADRATAGATGTIAHNWNAVPDGWHSFVNALKPAPASAGLANGLMMMGCGT